MRFIAPLVFAWIFLFVSCAKEEVEGFDSKITIAQDFRVDATTGDTFYRFYMPSAFTPDEDGVNDLYQVVAVGADVNNYVMRVFSREGNMIFYTGNIHMGFDGAVMGHGEYSAQQVYTVDIRVADITGEMHHYNYKIVAVF